MILIALISLLSGTRCQVANCASKSTLLGLGLTPMPFAIDQSGTCSSYYNTSGSCVDSSTTRQSMDSLNNFFQTQVTNALNYYSLFPNSTLFWQVSHGFASIDSSQDIGSWINSLLQLGSSAYNILMGMFANSISPYKASTIGCLSIIANLSKSAFCAVSSGLNVTLGPPSAVFPDSIPLSVPVDTMAVGPSLAKCLPLIDTYCSLSYGVSVLNYSKPFNSTFNLSDGGLSINSCKTIQFLVNCTTSTCNTTLWRILINSLSTNFIPFVPSQATIASFGSYINSFNNQSFYSQVAATPQGFGIGFLAADNVNGYDLLKGAQMTGSVPFVYSSSLVTVSLLAVQLSLNLFQ